MVVGEIYEIRCAEAYAWQHSVRSLSSNLTQFGLESSTVPAFLDLSLKSIDRYLLCSNSASDQSLVLYIADYDFRMYPLLATRSR